MIEKLIKFIEEHPNANLFVDCQQGDKFLVQDVVYSKNDNSIEFKVSPKSIKWIELDGRYPIKIMKDYGLQKVVC